MSWLSSFDPSFNQPSTSSSLASSSSLNNATWSQGANRGAPPGLWAFGRGRGRGRGRGAFGGARGRGIVAPPPPGPRQEDAQPNEVASSSRLGAAPPIISSNKPPVIASVPAKRPASSLPSLDAPTMTKKQRKEERKRQLEQQEAELASHPPKLTWKQRSKERQRRIDELDAELAAIPQMSKKQRQKAKKRIMDERSIESDKRWAKEKKKYEAERAGEDQREKQRLKERGKERLSVDGHNQRVEEEEAAREQRYDIYTRYEHFERYERYDRCDRYDRYDRHPQNAGMGQECVSREIKGLKTETTKTGIGVNGNQKEKAKAKAKAAENSKADSIEVERAKVKAEGSRQQPGKAIELDKAKMRAREIELDRAKAEERQRQNQKSMELEKEKAKARARSIAEEREKQEKERREREIERARRKALEEEREKERETEREREKEREKEKEKERKEQEEKAVEREMHEKTRREREIMEAKAEAKAREEKVETEKANLRRKEMELEMEMERREAEGKRKEQAEMTEQADVNAQRSKHDTPRQQSVELYEPNHLLQHIVDVPQQWELQPMAKSEVPMSSDRTLENEPTVPLSTGDTSRKFRDRSSELLAARVDTSRKSADIAKPYVPAKVRAGKTVGSVTPFGMRPRLFAPLSAASSASRSASANTANDWDALVAVSPHGKVSTITRSLEYGSISAAALHSVEDVKRITTKVVAIASSTKSVLGLDAQPPQISLVRANSLGGLSKQHTVQHLDPRPHLNGVSCLSNFPRTRNEGIDFATGGSDRIINHWRCSSEGTVVTRLHAAHTKGVVALEHLSRHNLLVSGAEGKVFAYDLVKNALPISWSTSDKVVHIQRVPNPDLFCVSYARIDYDQFKLYDIRERQVSRSVINFGWLAGNDHLGRGRGRGIFHPTRKSVFAFGCDDGCVRFWDLRVASKVLHSESILKMGSQPVESIIWDQDGSTLFSLNPHGISKTAISFV